MIGVNWDTLNVTLGVMVSIGFLIGFVWALAKLVIGFQRWRHKKLTSEVAADLALLAKEVQPNGGSSLRDAVDRIESKLDAVVLQTAAVDSKLERHLGQHEGTFYHDGLRRLS